MARCITAALEADPCPNPNPNPDPDPDPNPDLTQTQTQTLTLALTRCTAAALEGATALESSLMIRHATVGPGGARAAAPHAAKLTYAQVST